MTSLNDPMPIPVGTSHEIIEMALVYAERRRHGRPVGRVHSGPQREMGQSLCAFFGTPPDAAASRAAWGEGA